MTVILTLIVGLFFAALFHSTGFAFFVVGLCIGMLQGQITHIYDVLGLHKEDEDDLSKHPIPYEEDVKNG